MGEELVSRKIRTLRERLEALTADAGKASLPSEASWIALEELHVALEELQVAQEELRQQNESLEASRQTVEAQRHRYQDLFEFAPDAYLVTDRDGTIWEANQAAAQLLGAEAKFLVQKPLVLYFVEDQRLLLRDRLSRLPQLGQIREWEVRLKPRQGPPLDAAVTAAVVRDREGRVFGFRWLLRDITERKRVEEGARTSSAELERRVAERTRQLEVVNHAKDELLVQEQAAQRRLTFLAEASIALASSLDYQTTLDRVAHLAVPYLADWCCVFLVEEDGSIHRLALAHRDPSKEEQAGQLMNGQPPDAHATEGVAQVVRTGRSALYPEISDALLGAIIRDEGNRQLIRDLGAESGMAVPLSARGRTLGAITFALAGEGRRYGAADLALAEDLARRAAVAIDNARLYHEGQEADRRKNEFLAMLAHELRNPLAPLRTAVHLLGQNRGASAATRHARDVIERQVQTMSRLVDDLLDVSRITRGKVQLRKEVMELAGVVNRSLEDTRPVIEERRHALAVSLPPEPVRLEADPTRLEQVLTNLLTNAAKYTEPGGRIWLTAQRQGQEVELRVRDSGIGMAPEILQHAFELFTQAERSLDRSQGGLGVGLTLVRNLVELHGGSIRATSPGLGQGSEFILRLPVLPDGPAKVETSAPAEDPGRRRRVLLVEDHPDAAETLRLLLEEWGHEVEVAADGPSALAKARARPPDVALLDIGLPGMDGYELARRLRQEVGLEGTLLVALTGYGKEEDRRRCLEAGFNLHLVKPVDPAALQSILAQAEMLTAQEA